MTGSPADAHPRFEFPVRLWGFAIALSLATGLITAAWQGTPQVILSLLTEGLFPLLNLTAATLFGLAIVRRLIPEWNLALMIGCGATIGLGATSTMALLLGLAGWLSAATSWCLLAVLAGAGSLDLALRLRRTPNKWLRPAPSDHSPWLLLIPAFAVGFMLSAASLPPGGLWGNEPNGYDVVAYHLQLPREWFEAGRIVPLDHNIFSYFPLAAEMQFLLLMYQGGGAFEQLYAPQYLQVLILLMGGLVVAGTVWQQTRCLLASVLAGGVLVCLPWSVLLGSIAYNEVFLLLAAATCVAAVLELWHSTRLVGPACVAGLGVGLAIASKYTAVPMLFFPAFLAVVISSFRASTSRRILPAIVFLAGVLVFSGPWLVRNLAWTGNPVYPLAAGVFGDVEGRPDALQERWREAHAPSRDIAEVAGRLGSEVLWSPLYGWVGPLVIVAAGIMILLTKRQRPAGLLLGAWLIAALLTWLVATHLQGRFLYLAVAPAAVLLGLAVNAKGEWFITATALIKLFRKIFIGGKVLVARVTTWLRSRGSTRLIGYKEFSSLLMSITSKGLTIRSVLFEASILLVLLSGPVIGMQRLLENPSARMSRQTTENLFGITTLIWTTPFSTADQVRGRDVFMVGDAKAYFMPFDQLHYRSVFDVPPAEGAIRAWLGDALEAAAPESFVVIDGAEVRRLHETYGTPLVEFPVNEQPGQRTVMTLRDVRTRLQN